MPRNLQEQILVHIVRLSTEGYSQREVAIMLGVSQGFSDAADTLVGHISRDVEVGDSDHSLKRQTIDPNDQGQLYSSRLLVCSCI